MSRQIRYIFNEQTQAFEVDRLSARATGYKTGAVLLGGITCFLIFFFVFVQIRGNASPKEILLQHNNRMLAEQIGMLEGRIEAQDAVLLDLSLRDNLVYRPVFGMEEIPAEERGAGLGGPERYDVFLGLDHGDLMSQTARQVDQLTRKAYVQTLSFDEVRIYSSRAGDMASCIPAIPPFSPEKGKYTLSSPFGYRSDPISGTTKYHDGQDFAMKPGTPVYATGDGVVEYVKFSFTGYGNEILIDHGFGYKTRYAHMSVISVAEGMKLKRGDCIGESGNSGKSTGPHLHYEVLYRGDRVNPMNYLDIDMPVKEYAEMVRKRGDETKELLQQSFRMRRR